jgi:predicted nucleic acid-binding protein
MSTAPTAFGRGATVYLDTNPIIYLTEGNPAFKAQIASLFEALDAADARLVTSELTLAEVLVRPLREQDTALVEAYERLFDTLLQAQPVSREVLLLSAQLRAETRTLRTPDAIHVATAALVQASHFVSGDAGIRTLPEGMQRVQL